MMMMKKKKKRCAELLKPIGLSTYNTQRRTRVRKIAWMERKTQQALFQSLLVLVVVWDTGLGSEEGKALHLPSPSGLNLKQRNGGGWSCTFCEASRAQRSRFPPRLASADGRKITNSRGRRLGDVEVIAETMERFKGVRMVVLLGNKPLGEPTVDRQQLSVVDDASPCGSDDVLLDLVRDHLVQRQQVPDVLRHDLHSRADIAEGLDASRLSEQVAWFVSAALSQVWESWKVAVLCRWRTKLSWLRVISSSLRQSSMPEGDRVQVRRGVSTYATKAALGNDGRDGASGEMLTPSRPRW
ncbi:hypothetical protein Cni_G17723 [Canna indica]|uniref:Uncharacterized protein n=1 Tax=Canna indica TaxID=4628 RepID=A0AAQ3QI11_9LILI|nr:hypothetical protein Cni_G17723 [Canna indica]